MFLENMILTGLSWSQCGTVRDMVGAWPSHAVRGEGGLAWTPGCRAQAALICHRTSGLSGLSPLWEMATQGKEPCLSLCV